MSVRERRRHDGGRGRAAAGAGGHAGGHRRQEEDRRARSQDHRGDGAARRIVVVQVGREARRRGGAGLPGQEGRQQRLLLLRVGVGFRQGRPEQGQREKVQERRGEARRFGQGESFQSAFHFIVKIMLTLRNLH